MNFNLKIKATKRQRYSVKGVKRDDRTIYRATGTVYSKTADNSFQESRVDFGKLADLTSDFINYTETALQNSEAELKNIFKEIFHAADETGRYRLETDFMLLQGPMKRGARELWVEMLKFKTEREELADEELVLDKQNELASANYEMLKNLVLGDATTEEDSQSSTSPIPKQPAPPHPTTRKVLPKLGEKSGEEKATRSVNLTETLAELNCTAEDVDDCLENISCPRNERSYFKISVLKISFQSSKTAFLEHT